MRPQVFALSLAIEGLERAFQFPAPKSKNRPVSRIMPGRER